MTLMYDIIFLLFAIVYLPYLVFTGRYHKDFRQRFGFYPREVIDGLKGRGVIWLHAVSVGEVMASRILCEMLIKNYPEKKLVISTVTKTGNGVARKFFEGKAAVVYLPVDISWAVNKALDKIRPGLFIIVETEIWPNLITALHNRNIPVVIVNGRISRRSYGRYMKVRFLIKGILEKVTLFSMQNDEYAGRIKNMGAPEERVAVTGNMKFDTAVRVFSSGRLNTDAIRNDLALKEGQPLIIAGSTHSPEEEIVLRAYRGLLKEFPGLSLLIAPRHIERVPEVEEIIRKSGFTPLRLSRIANPEPRTPNDEPRTPNDEPRTPNDEPRTPNDESPVLLLDTMGRLSQLFSVATIAFIGGSLMRKGGQNILEPAVFSKPVVFGPHMFNFRDMAETFLKEDAACMVKNEKELLGVFGSLLKDAERRFELGSRAKMLIERHKGASERNMKEIAKILMAYKMR